jgi:hypothetical protein
LAHVRAVVVRRGADESESTWRRGISVA